MDTERQVLGREMPPPHGAQKLTSPAAWLSRALVPCHSQESIFPAACRVPAGHGVVHPLPLFLRKPKQTEKHTSCMF